MRGEFHDDAGQLEQCDSSWRFVGDLSNYRGKPGMSTAMKPLGMELKGEEYERYRKIYLKKCRQKHEHAHADNNQSLSFEKEKS